MLITMVQKEYPPSQKKYHANNPTVSFRLPKVLKKKLEKLAERGDMTVGQYVRHFLEGVVTEREKEDKIHKDGFDNGRNEGLEEGYKQGMKAWQIWVNCSVCGKQGYIEPQSELHKMILEGGPFIPWGHKPCLEGKRINDLLIPRDIQTLFLAAQTESPKSDGKKDKEERAL